LFPPSLNRFLDTFATTAAAAAVTTAATALDSAYRDHIAVASFDAHNTAVAAAPLQILAVAAAVAVSGTFAFALCFAFGFVFGHRNISNPCRCLDIYIGLQWCYSGFTVVLQ
jgi:hypothetical protein